jgi:hypothetical protein
MNYPEMRQIADNNNECYQLKKVPRFRICNGLLKQQIRKKIFHYGANFWYATVQGDYKCF